MEEYAVQSGINAQIALWRAFIAGTEEGWMGAVRAAQLALNDATRMETELFEEALPITFASIRISPDAAQEFLAPPTTTNTQSDFYEYRELMGQLVDFARAQQEAVPLSWTGAIQRALVAPIEKMEDDTCDLTGATKKSPFGDFLTEQRHLSEPTPFLSIARVFVPRLHAASGNPCSGLTQLVKRFYLTTKVKLSTIIDHALDAPFVTIRRMNLDFIILAPQVPADTNISLQIIRKKSDKTLRENYQRNTSAIIATHLDKVNGLTERLFHPRERALMEKKNRFAQYFEQHNFGRLIHASPNDIPTDSDGFVTIKSAQDVSFAAQSGSLSSAMGHLSMVFTGPFGMVSTSRSSDFTYVIDNPSRYPGVAVPADFGHIAHPPELVDAPEALKNRIDLDLYARNIYSIADFKDFFALYAAYLFDSPQQAILFFQRHYIDIDSEYALDQKMIDTWEEPDRSVMNRMKELFETYGIIIPVSPEIQFTTEVKARKVDRKQLQQEERDYVYNLIGQTEVSKPLADCDNRAALIFRVFAQEPQAGSGCFDWLAGSDHPLINGKSVIVPPRGIYWVSGTWIPHLFGPNKNVRFPFSGSVLILGPSKTGFLGLFHWVRGEEVAKDTLEDSVRAVQRLSKNPIDYVEGMSISRIDPGRDVFLVEYPAGERVVMAYLHDPSTVAKYVEYFGSEYVVVGVPITLTEELISRLPRVDVLPERSTIAPNMMFPYVVGVPLTDVLRSPEKFSEETMRNVIKFLDKVEEGLSRGGYLDYSFRTINSLAPKDTWIDNIVVTPDGSVKIRDVNQWFDQTKGVEQEIQAIGEIRQALTSVVSKILEKQNLQNQNKPFRVKLADAIDKAVSVQEKRCGDSLGLLRISLGARSGQYGYSQGENSNDQYRQEKRDGEIAHNDFLAMRMLNPQINTVAKLPMSITNQSSLSTPVIAGDTTVTANMTLPALSRILDIRDSWDSVNTGSFQRYITPDKSINFIVPFVRTAYAADGDEPASTGGFGCGFVRWAAPYLKTFTQTLRGREIDTSLRVIGAIDPRDLTREQFEQAPDVLWYGVGRRDFVFSRSYGYDDPNSDGSQTLDEGFYTTKNRSIAEYYSKIRQSQNTQDVKETFARAFLPHNARMYDFRTSNGLHNRLVSEEFTQEWAKYFLTWFNITYAENSLKAPRPVMEYAQFMQKVANGEIDKPLSIFQLLGTGVSEDWRNSNVSLDVPGLFSTYMRGLGYDGIIVMEGVDGTTSTQEDASYVFYNLNVIGDYDTWHSDNQFGIQSLHDFVMQKHQEELKPLLESGENVEEQVRNIVASEYDAWAQTRAGPLDRETLLASVVEKIIQERTTLSIKASIANLQLSRFEKLKFIIDFVLPFIVTVLLIPFYLQQFTLQQVNALNETLATLGNLVDFSFLSWRLGDITGSFMGIALIELLYKAPLVTFLRSKLWKPLNRIIEIFHMFISASIILGVGYLWELLSTEIRNKPFDSEDMKAYGTGLAIYLIANTIFNIFSYAKSRGWSIRNGLSALWRGIKSLRVGATMLLLAGAFAVASLMSVPTVQEAAEIQQDVAEVFESCKLSDAHIVGRVYAAEGGVIGGCVGALADLVVYAPIRVAQAVFGGQPARPSGAAGPGPTPSPQPMKQPAINRINSPSILFAAMLSWSTLLTYAMIDDICSRLYWCIHRFDSVSEKLIQDEKRGIYISEDKDTSSIESALEQYYGIAIASYDGNAIQEDELKALAITLDLLPVRLKIGNDLMNNPSAGYIFVFHDSSVDDDYKALSHPFGIITINDNYHCTDSEGVVCGDNIDTYVHEILHQHDVGLVESDFCITVDRCETLTAFVNAAQADAVTFNSNGEVEIFMSTERESKWYVEEEFPDYEMFAYFGSRYVTDPIYLQTNFSNIYEFYRESVYDEVEYQHVITSSGETIIVQK